MNLSKSVIILLLLVSAYGGVAAQPISQPQLSVVSAENKSAEIYDFGSVRYGEKVSHVFTLRNTGKESLTLDRVEAQCGCTTAFLMDQFAGRKPVLNPGETAKVSATLDTSRLTVADVNTLNGSVVHKRVMVYVAEEPIHPVIAVELQGSINQGISFDPPLLEWGNVREDKGAQKSFKVIYDIDRYAPEKTHLTVSGDNRISIELKKVERSQGKVVETYNAALPKHAYISPLNGMFTITPVEEGKSKGAQSLPFTGIVTGNITAEPANVVYGMLPDKDGFGKPYSAEELKRQRIRWILLINKRLTKNNSGEFWKNTVTQAADKWIGVSLVPAYFDLPKDDGGINPPSLKESHLAPETAMWLRVELLPETEHGKWLNGLVELTFPDKERIMLPVSGQLD